MSQICGYCEAEREFRSEDRVETYTVRGLKLEFPVQVEVCIECGHDLYDENMDQDLVLLAYAAYRSQKGLLQPDEIVAIRNRYALSQKSLAALLGMSEATINRYENGGLQDYTHDSALRLAASPENMRDMLNRRGDLLSPWQRDRAMKAVQAELSNRIWLASLIIPQAVSDKTGMRGFDYRRYAAAVICLCTELGSVYRTKLNKLLFYADYLAFKHYTRSVTGTAYRKIQFGPVPEHYLALEEALEADDFIQVEERETNDGTTNRISPGPAASNVLSVLSEEEQAVLSFVADEFRWLSTTTLSERSHKEDAYIQTEDKQIISYEYAATLSLSLPGKE